MMGGNFALIAGNEKHATRIVENVGRYGLREKLHAVRAMSVTRLVDLDAGFTDSAAGTALVDEFLAAAGGAADAGAEVAIPAIGVLMVLLAERGVHSVNGNVPVLNGVVALVKTAESVVRMRRLMGGNWTSKRATYAPPPAFADRGVRARLRKRLSGRRNIRIGKVDAMTSCHCAVSADRVAVLRLAAASAQDFPNRPLRMVVPYAAGGGVDIVARAVSQELSKRVGQPVIVENRTGAGSNIGSDSSPRRRPTGTRC